jgi:predicted ribosomally synthesized peptide with nif11-like leader
MTQEQIQALIQAVSSSPDLQQKLAAATNIEDAARIAAEAGFELSSDDINEAINGASVELTDAELETVAGGSWGQLIKSLINGGESCGNAVQKLTCNVIEKIENK